MNVLPLTKKVEVIAALIEGSSIRSVERMTGVHRDTIMRLGRDVGEGCTKVHDQAFRDLNVGVLEVDELWSFIGKKQGHLRQGDAPEFGDCYTFTGISATTKAMVSYLVGRRDGECTDEFCADLRVRILNRPQITSDGYKPYTEAIEKAFGLDVDYAQAVKEYGGAAEAMPLARRYSPPRVTSSEKIKVAGSPNADLISTSYVERSNLTVRMTNRRFTRLTNAYSKKWRNHEASVGLTIAAYNFVKVHSTLRTTPAMAQGVTDHIWTVEELVLAALAVGPTVPKKSAPVAPRPTPSGDLLDNSKWGGVPADRIPSGGVGQGRTKRPTLTVIDGGKK